MNRTLHVPALWMSFAGFICLGLPDGTLGVAWPSLRDGLGRAQGDFGLMLLVHGASYFLSGLAAAWGSRRFRAATLLTFASLIVASGMLLMAASAGWWGIVLAVACIGCGSGIINTTINTYASRHFSPRHVNWLHACYSLGAAVGPLIMTAVMTHAASWQAGYVLIAVVPIAMALVYLLTSARWRPSVQESGASGTPSPRVNSLLVRQAVLFFCYSGLELTLGRWCYTVLTEARGLGPESAGVAASCFFGGIFAGRLLLGAAVDAIGATRMVRFAAIVAVLGTSAFAFANGGMAAIGLVLAGFALAPIFPTLVAQSAGRFPPDQLASVIAICVAAAIAGSAVIPYVAGLATSVLGLNAVGLLATGLAVALVVMHESVARPTAPSSTEIQALES